MQFTYHLNSGSKELKIDGELHKYLFKVRRHSSKHNIYFRNLSDNILYEYKVINTTRRDALLQLISSKILPILPIKNLHIAWCIIDYKNIEKVIASLNEIGVSKITFIHCKYSQNNIKINYDKLNKILINSSCQCGRSGIIQLEESKCLNEFISNNKDAYMINFSSNNINNHKDDIKTIILGCEGGFSKEELNLISGDMIVGVNSNLILRSETAIVSIASIILF